MEYCGFWPCAAVLASMTEKIDQQLNYSVRGEEPRLDGLLAEFACVDGGLGLDLNTFVFATTVGNIPRHC